MSACLHLCRLHEDHDGPCQEHAPDVDTLEDVAWTVRGIIEDALTKHEEAGPYHALLRRILAGLDGALVVTMTREEALAGFEAAMATATQARARLLSFDE